MDTQQTGILPPPHEHGLFVTLRRRIGRRANLRTKHILADIPKKSAELQQADLAADFCSVVAFGSRIWHELWPDNQPQELRPFPCIGGAIHPVPSSEVDLLLHLRCHRYDLLHDFADRLVNEFSDWMEVLEAVHGFRYHTDRGLSGFIEGPINPADAKERQQMALVGAADPEWQDGSYVHIQRYVHSLEQWRKLPLRQQETIIGRQMDGRDISSEDRAKTAHLSRVELREQDKKLQLLRQSMSYGIPGQDQGLYFCGYCHTPSVFEKTLTRMVSPTVDGRVDLLLNYTRAVTGAALFAPSIPRLEELHHAQE